MDRREKVVASRRRKGFPEKKGQLILQSNSSPELDKKEEDVESMDFPLVDAFL